MAMQTCFRRFRLLQKLCLNKALQCSKMPFLNTKSPLTSPSSPTPCSRCVTRTFCSDGRQSDDPNNKINVKGTNLIITQGPLGWLSKTVNLWFLKRFIDREFEEREFLRGAKQALCAVSDLLDKQDFEEMEGVLTEKLASNIKNNAGTEKLGSAVTMQEILSANIQKVRFGFVDNGRGKVVDIQVAYMCNTTENQDKLFQRQLGNVKIIGIPVPKMIYYTFRKIVFPDSVSSWQVEDIFNLQQ